MTDGNNEGLLEDHAMMKYAIAIITGLFSVNLAAAPEGSELLKKIDSNLQPTSYEMYRKLINVEPDGSKKEFVLYTIKKGQENMIALFLDPPSEKGRSSLRQGDNMWLYIPNVGKPLRITSLQSVVGGVFNNSDILRLDYSSEYNVENVVDQDKQYVLHLKAKTKTVAYDKLTMYADKKALVPMKIEAFAATGMLIKTLHYKNLKDFGDGVKRPSVLETDSPLFKGYKSVMLYSRIKKRQFDDEVFSLSYLPRVEELR